MSAQTSSSQPSASLGHQRLYLVELKQAFGKFHLLRELHFDASQIIRHSPSEHWIHVLLTKEQAENLEKNAHVRSVSRVSRRVPMSARTISSRSSVRFDASKGILHSPSEDWIHVLLTKEQAENLEENEHVRSVSRVPRGVPKSAVRGEDYESVPGALINETKQYPKPSPENLNYPSSGAPFWSSSKGVSGKKRKQKPPGSELVIDEATGKASTPSDFGAGFLNLDVMNPNNVGVEHEKENPNPKATKKKRSREKKALEAEGE